MNNLTPAQLAWLHAHQDYSPIGKAKPGVRYNNVGTLHGDGTFEPTVPARPRSLLMTPIKLRLDGMSIGVGIRIAEGQFAPPAG